MVNINLRTTNEEPKQSFFDRARRPSMPTPPTPTPPSPPPAPSPAPEERKETGVKRDNKFIVKVFDRIVDLSIFMIFFGFPLFFTGLSAQGVVFEKQIYFYVWILLGLVAWTAKGVTIGEMSIRRTPLDLPILGLWIAALLSTIFSVDRWHSFWGAFSDPSRGFMSITALVIAYYLIFSHFNAKRFRIIMTGTILSGIIISVWTLLAILNIKFLPDAIAQYAPISLSGSMLGIAIIISGLVPLLTVAILKIAGDESKKPSTRKVLAIILLLALALDLFLLLALYNFVPWLALFIGVVILLVFILSQIVRPTSSWTWLPMVVFVVVMALKMVGVVPIAKINFAEVKPLDFDTSMSIAKEALRSKPFLGSGPATYGYDFSLYRPQSFNANMFYNLRFLQGTGMVAEAIPTLGAVGSFFLIILLLSFFSLETYLISKEKEKNKLMALGLFSAAAIFLVGAITTKIEGTIFIMAVLMGITALAIALMESNSEKKFLSLSLKASPKFALALAFVFMVVSAGVAFLFVFLGKVYVADVYAGKAAKVTADTKDNSVNYMSQAIRFYTQEGKYYTQLGQYYMALANDEALKGENERDVQKIKLYINNAVTATTLGKNMMKSDVSSVEALAQIYENTGLYVSDSYSLALDNYQEASNLEPHNPNFYLKMGQIKLAMAAAQKDTNQKKQLVTEAEGQFSKSIEEKTDLAEGYYQLSIAQNALGENDASIESAKKAVSANPNNGDYILNLARFLQSRGTDSDMKDAEQLYKAVIAQNDKDINSHFYLGLLYEKQKNKQGAKDEYNKVISLLPTNNDDTKKQLQKMIANVDAGIENTPQTLGLTQQSQDGTQGAATPDQGATTGQ